MVALRWVFLLSLLSCLAWTQDCNTHGQGSDTQLIQESVREQTFAADNQVKICAFNIQIFGKSKMKKPAAVQILRKILVRYDVILIQEIRDASGTAIKELLKEVNQEEGGLTFKMEISDRLGRTGSKEEYAYFYRFNKVQITSTYQYPDPKDVFERPPFVVKIKAPGTKIQEFGYIGIHVKPSDAVNEIDALVDVYDHMVKQWKMEDFVLAGDFNAGCSYVRASHWPKIRLRQDSRFQWLIDDKTKTNIGEKMDCPYDRFVIAGNSLVDNLVPGSAAVYRFDQVHKLSHDETKVVSDHFPIEFSVQ